MASIQINLEKGKTMDEKKEVMKIDMGSEGTRTVSVNFPSNSHKVKEEKPEEKRVKKVTTGMVVRQKKTLGKKFAETFFGEEASNVGRYILYDVLIPAAKDTVVDMVKGGIEMFFYGEKKGTRTRRDQGRSYVSYNSYSNRDRHDDRRDDRRNFSSQSRARHDFDEIVLSSRGEAEEVLSHLVDLTIDYRQATVADLYDLVGITSNFTDNKYGWTDLGSASVGRARNGWMLNLPRPYALD